MHRKTGHTSRCITGEVSGFHTEICFEGARVSVGGGGGGGGGGAKDSRITQVKNKYKLDVHVEQYT